MLCFSKARRVPYSLRFQMKVFMLIIWFLHWDQCSINSRTKELSSVYQGWVCESQAISSLWNPLLSWEYVGIMSPKESGKMIAWLRLKIIIFLIPNLFRRLSQISYRNFITGMVQMNPQKGYGSLQLSWICIRDLTCLIWLHTMTLGSMGRPTSPLQLASRMELTSLASRM